MIIDQLPLLSGDIATTDEVAVERGTTTYKAEVSQILDPVYTYFNGEITLANSRIDGLETSKQDKITANGMLKGTSSGVVAATKGTDYGAAVITVTLPAADWTNKQQEISNVNFWLTGFMYFVAPAQASRANYSGVYADKISTTGKMMFHCDTVPTADLDVIIVKIVSTNNATVNIGG